MSSKPNVFRIIKIAAVTTLSLGVIAGCLNQIGANNGKTGRVSLSPFTDDAIRALPLTATGLKGSSAYRVMNTPMTLVEEMVSKFFKLECHIGEGDNFVNYCPVDTPLTMDNKFTLGSLIGLIDHADMVVKNHFDPKKESDPNPIVTLHASSFQTSDEGGQANRFLLDFYSLMNRKGSNIQEKQNYAYGNSADGKFITAVSIRKHAPVVTPPNDTSDLMQVVISKDSSDSAEVLGFNVATIDLKGTELLAQRIILLVNLKTRNFLVKARYSDQYWLVAAGKGGINPSGAREPGYFYIKVGDTFDSSGLATAARGGACVDNATMAIASESNVVEELKLWDGSLNAASYLSLDAATAETMKPFLQFFSNADPLSAADTPRTKDEYRDFPDKIQ